MSAIQRVARCLLRRVSDPLKISACVPRCKISLTFLISYFWSLFLVHVCTAGESAPLTCLKMSAISYSDVIHCIFLHFQDFVYFLRWLIPPNMNNRTISQSTSRKDNQHFLPAMLTWRLCAAVHTGCESCLKLIYSRRRSWDSTACLLPPSSAPRRCTVATRTAGAAPVAGETDRTGVTCVCVCVEKVGEEFTMAVKERDGHQKPPWSAAMFTRWIKFHLFVYLL